jgi:hypothetical protein
MPTKRRVADNANSPSGFIGGTKDPSRIPQGYAEWLMGHFLYQESRDPTVTSLEVASRRSKSPQQLMPPGQIIFIHDRTEEENL